MGRGCQRGASPLSGTLWLGDAPQELRGATAIPGAAGCPRDLPSLGGAQAAVGPPEGSGPSPHRPRGQGQDPPPEVGPEGEFGGGLMCSWPAGEGASS